MRQIDGHVSIWLRSDADIQSGLMRLADWELVDSTGTQVLRMVNHHFGQNPRTQITLANQATFNFPVRGHFKAAVMFAKDSGTHRSLISYRLTAKRPPTLAITSRRQNYSVEIVVSPEAQSLPAVALLVAVSAHLLREYFLPWTWYREWNARLFDSH